MSEFIEILSTESKKDLDKFIKDLDRGVRAVKELNEEFRKVKAPSDMGKVIHKSNQEIEKSNKLRKEGSRILEKRRLEELRLQRNRERAFDKYEAGLKKQEAQEKRAARARESQVNKESQLRQRLQKQREKEEKQAAKINAINKKMGNAYNKLQSEVRQLSERYKHLATRQQMGIKLSKSEEKELKDVTRQLNRKQTALKKVDSNMGVYNRNVGNYKSALSGAAGAAKNLATQMGLLSGVFLVGSVIRDAFKRVREFDKEMQKLAGITGESRQELADIEGVIKDVAGASISTSNDVAQLATVLFQLGKTKDEVELLLEPVNNLALGLDTTAEQAGEFLVQTLNAFGKGSESGQEFADKIAKISISTALDFQRMVDSFQYLAPVAQSVGMTLDDVGAIIGVLNDNGIKAQRAGRLMGTAFQKLGKDGKSLEQALDEVSEIQSTATDKFAALGEVSKIFGSQAASLALILADNREEIDAYAESFKGAGGALETLTNKQLKSLDAQLKILDSAWESYILDTNEATGASNILRDAVSFLSRNLREIINTILYATTVWAGYKAMVLLSRLQTSLMSKALATQTLTAKANAAGISTARLAWVKFNRVLKANAIGLVVTALAGLIYLLSKYNKSLEEVHEANQQQYEDFKKDAEIKKQNIRETEDLITQYDTLKNKAGSNAEAQEELNDVFLKLKDNVPDVVKEFDEYGKVIGINTTKLKDLNAEQLKGLEYQAKVGLEESKEHLDDLLQQQKTLRSVINTMEKRKGDSLLGVKIYSDEDFADAYKKLNKLSGLIDETKKSVDGYNETLESLNQENYLFEEEMEQTNLIKQIMLLDEMATEAELCGLSVGELKERLAELKDEGEKTNVLIKGTAAYFNDIISNLKRQRNTLATTKEEWMAYNKKIAETLELLDKLKGIEKALDLPEPDSEPIEPEEISPSTDIEDGALERKLARDKAELESERDKEKEKTKISKEEVAKRAGIVIDSLQTIGDYYGIDLSKFKKLFQDKELTVEEYAEAAKEILLAVGNAIFQGNINRINAEIAANDEKYDTLIRLAEGNERKQQALMLEQERNRKRLLAKKAREEKKAAIFSAIINGAAATVRAFVDGGVVLGAIVAALSAAQVAIIASQPVPKYAKGRKGGKEEMAIIGDGGKNEPVLDKKGNLKYISPDKPTLTKLDYGDTVLPDMSMLNGYDIERAAIMTSLAVGSHNLSQAGARKEFDYAMVAQGLKKEIVNSLRHARFINQNNVNLDLNHPLKREKYN